MVQQLGVGLLVRWQDVQEGSRGIARSTPWVQGTCSPHCWRQAEGRWCPRVEALLVKWLRRIEITHERLACKYKSARLSTWATSSRFRNKWNAYCAHFTQSSKLVTKTKSVSKLKLQFKLMGFSRWCAVDVYTSVLILNLKMNCGNGHSSVNFRLPLPYKQMH